MMGRLVLVGICVAIMLCFHDCVVATGTIAIRGPPFTQNAPWKGRSIFNVESFGAVGDGVTDDTQAFLDAWKAACYVESAILLVPKLKTFLVKTCTFQGPCQPHLTFRVSGTLIAPEDPQNWSTNIYWLRFTKLEHFNLVGKGTIWARGRQWWGASCSYINHRRICTKSPNSICFQESEKILVERLRIIDSPHFHLNFLHCNHVTVASVRITSPWDSPNTDGIHLEHTKNVIILDSMIKAGDDCVSIGHGSYNVTISRLTCGPGHGISIGSLGKWHSGAQVHKILVEGAKLSNTNNGLRIKTWQGGYGWARDIVFQNIEMINVSNPIIIDQYYCDSPNPCPNRTSAVKISDITFKDIVGTSRKNVAVRLACSNDVPCKRIMLSNISLTPATGRETTSFCYNAHGKVKGVVNPPSCLS